MNKDKAISTERALKLALEALEVWGEWFPDNWGDLDTEAVTALREALASQGEALASEAIEQPTQQCKYGNNPASCTLTVHWTACALDAVFEKPAPATELREQEPVAKKKHEPTIDLDEYAGTYGGYTKEQK